MDTAASPHAAASAPLNRDVVPGLRELLEEVPALMRDDARYEAAAKRAVDGDQKLHALQKQLGFMAMVSRVCSQSIPSYLQPTINKWLLPRPAREGALDSVCLTKLPSTF